MTTYRHLNFSGLYKTIIYDTKSVITNFSPTLIRHHFYNSKNERNNLRSCFFIYSKSTNYPPYLCGIILSRKYESDHVPSDRLKHSWGRIRNKYGGGISSLYLPLLGPGNNKTIFTSRGNAWIYAQTQRAL